LRARSAWQTRLPTNKNKTISKSLDCFALRARNNCDSAIESNRLHHLRQCHPNSEPTMAEIYETAMQQSHQSSLAQIRSQLKNNNTCCASTDIDATHLFPILPNPQLVMYVYTHFSTQDEAPIPGYTSVFNLYEKMYYAMEGENINISGNN
jgi:conjugative transfer region lipoprotein (TIGR03751 family)